MTDFNDRIERLAELDGEASIENWWIDPISEEILCPCSINTCEPDLVGRAETKEDAELICALRNEALPLLREMAQALSEAKAENVGLKGQFLDHAETDSYLRMVKYAAHVKDLYRWEKEQKEAAQAEYEGLRARQAKLKETLLPVCEYGAEIYNRGTPAIPMPDDTIQRLNWAFKMFGG